MILALAGTKGGTGKTTLTIALATAAALHGRRVLVIDADPRADGESWRKLAGGGAPRVLALAGRRLPDPDTLRGLSVGHDLTLVDTPSNRPGALLRILEATDHALVPIAPCAMQVWSVADTFELVARARAANPTLRASALINRVDPRTSLGVALPRDLASLGVPVLRTRVHARAVHAEAFAHGSAACEYAPASPAAREVLALLRELLQPATAALGVASSAH